MPDLVKKEQIIMILIQDIEIVIGEISKELTIQVLILSFRLSCRRKAS